MIGRRFQIAGDVMGRPRARAGLDAATRRTRADAVAKQSPQRKLIEFDAETWAALDLLRRDSFKTVQELADEAFADLLKKHHRPTDLKSALRESARELGIGERDKVPAKRRRR
jgi:hypothetical protein